MYFLSFHSMPFHRCLLFPFHFSTWIKSHLSIFFFSLYFWYQIQEVIAKTNVKKFPPPPPMVSLRNFIVSGITLTYLIHFALIFIYGIK